MEASRIRSRLIVETMRRVEEIMRHGATVEALNSAKSVLEEFAGKRELFPQSEFPWPSVETNNRCFCLYLDKAGSLALYLDLLRKGVSTVPHDHGASWAIVTSVEGREKHHLYERLDGGTGLGPAKLGPAGEITISAGQSVSLLVGGIHAIEAVGSDPAMMLHCYGLPFERQDTRLEYNISDGTCEYSISAAGDIENYPLDLFA